MDVDTNKIANHLIMIIHQLSVTDPDHRSFRGKT